MNWIQASFINDSKSFLTSGVLKSATLWESRGACMYMWWGNAAVALALLFLPNWDMTTTAGVALAAVAVTGWGAMAFMTYHACYVLGIAKALSSYPEDCKQALRLAGVSPKAKAWRDFVVSQAREFVAADLRYMRSLALQDAIESGTLIDFDTPNARKEQARSRNFKKMLLCATATVFGMTLLFVPAVFFGLGFAAAGFLCLGACLFEMEKSVETFSYEWAEKLTPLVRGPFADAELVARWENYGFIRCSWGWAAQYRVEARNTDDGRDACRALHGISGD